MKSRILAWFRDWKCSNLQINFVVNFVITLWYFVSIHSLRTRFCQITPVTLSVKITISLQEGFVCIVCIHALISSLPHTELSSHNESASSVYFQYVLSFIYSWTLVQISTIFHYETHNYLLNKQCYMTTKLKFYFE